MLKFGGTILCWSLQALSTFGYAARNSRRSPTSMHLQTNHWSDLAHVWWWNTLWSSLGIHFWKCSTEFSPFRLASDLLSRPNYWLDLALIFVQTAYGLIKLCSNSIKPLLTFHWIVAITWHPIGQDISPPFADTPLIRLSTNTVDQLIMGLSKPD